MRESLIQSGVVKHARSLGILCFKLDCSYLKGVPDFIFLLKNRIVFIEFKCYKGVLSLSQVFFQKRLKKLNIDFFVINDLNKGIELVNGFSI